MRWILEKGLRYFFYTIVGASMVLVTTPSLAAAFPGPSAFLLWPMTGLLAYVLHVFEDADKLARLLHRNSAAGRRSPASAGRLPRLGSSNAVEQA